MKIIAHRGYWKKTEEKNSLCAFKRAFLNGYGVETDIRDYCGKLVVSHNIADNKSIACDVFFNLYQMHGNGVPLALNVKADGIQELLKAQLEQYQIRNYFVFDMSVPEMVLYKHKKMDFFTRRSDVEKECVLYKDALGVWIDAFYDDMWGMLDSAKIDLNNGKRIVIVSPELHGRDKSRMWNAIKSIKLYMQEEFYLCTDYPNEAQEVFEEE